MSTTSDQVEQKGTGEPTKVHLTVRISSFGYKMGKAPAANALFDVRFLKNPFWVEELRPMTGRDLPVQEYVMNQKAARDFLSGLVEMLEKLIPRLEESNMSEFCIAFGCTGGQHRSATMVELLARELSEKLPYLTIERVHRELDAKVAKTPHQEDGHE